MIKWNTLNNEKLTKLWNENMDDERIAFLFGAGTYAIAKQRSNLGLVKWKKKAGLKRPQRVIQPKENPEFYAIHYVKEGQNHFSFLDTRNEEKAIELGRNLIYAQKVSDLTIMKPVTRLVCEKIKVIKL